MNQSPNQRPELTSLLKSKQIMLRFFPAARRSKEAGL
jgi:hypothetical protein